MHITLTTDYMIRTMLYMLDHEGELKQQRDIAEDVKIPVNYLSKIVRKLRDGGYIVALQGHKGGYMLAEKGKTATVYEIFMLNEPEKIQHCLEPEHECTRDAYGSCPFSMYCELLQDHIDNYMKCITLKELAPYRDKELIRQRMDEAVQRDEVSKQGEDESE